ncbi:hypothetical protein M0R45_001940 [Rubus argutus]|uniref:Probable sodium/metabolite cotransporter BASS4, chloroplastic n=1 Tax=Rubus argutus TaxID=59490 RepID=A0AAW1VHY0_RUBAR
MAGIIQTLVLTPPPTKILPFSHRILRSPSNHAAFRLNFHVSRSNLTPFACHDSDQIDGNGNKADKHSGSLKGSNWAKPLSNFVANNFLPLGDFTTFIFEIFISCGGGVALGIANPTLGCLADSYSLSKFSTFGIFVISGLTLHTGEIIAAADAWPVGIFGLVSILLFTPYFSRVIMQLQLQPQEFVRGLAIFCCMPTTLSSGVALSQLAGANSALALAMTVISNLLGILIVPFSISKFIGDGVGVSVPTKQLLKSLVLTLLIPLILGKMFRESFKGVADFVDNNRKNLSKISAILPVPWMQVSRSRSLLLMVKPAVFLGAIGMGVLLHLILLAFNALSIKSLSTLSGVVNQCFPRRKCQCCSPCRKPENSAYLPTNNAKVS